MDNRNEDLNGCEDTRRRNSIVSTDLEKILPDNRVKKRPETQMFGQFLEPEHLMKKAPKIN